MTKQPRLAAGRARALGLPTRGTTNPNRLRRMDNWIATQLAAPLRQAAVPLVVDLGYGHSPVTAVELLARLRRHRPGRRGARPGDRPGAGGRRPAGDPAGAELRRWAASSSPAGIR